MTIVAVHYPASVLSLSTSALHRSEGVLHHVKSVVRPSKREWGGYTEHDAFYVKTMCGQLIDAYPETHQTKSRDCERCVKIKSLDRMPLIRVIPPVDKCEGLWAQWYWRSVGGMFA